MLDRGNGFYVQGNGYDNNVMFWDINEPVGSFPLLYGYTQCVLNYHYQL